MGVSFRLFEYTGGITPMCDDCGVALCWDIDELEYLENKGFWDDWICQDCNGGIPLSLKQWIKNKKN
jgi:hypothetical protein